MEWIVYDYDAGISFFKTEAEANAYANDMLRGYRDDACDDGWDDGVEQIVVARVTSKARMVNREDMEGGGHFFDYLCDYELIPTDPGTEETK